MSRLALQCCCIALIARLKSESICLEFRYQCNPEVYASIIYAIREALRSDLNVMTIMKEMPVISSVMRCVILNTNHVHWHDASRWPGYLLHRSGNFMKLISIFIDEAKCRSKSMKIKLLLVAIKAINLFNAHGIASAHFRKHHSVKIYYQISAFIML